MCYIENLRRSARCVILLAEYRANYIRHCRAILLRSYIRLTRSGICIASFGANRISLQGKALQYHFPEGQCHFLRRQRISLSRLTEKERTNREIRNALSFLLNQKNDIWFVSLSPARTPLLRRSSITVLDTPAFSLNS